METDECGGVGEGEGEGDEDREEGVGTGLGQGAEGMQGAEEEGGGVEGVIGTGLGRGGSGEGEGRVGEGQADDSGAVFAGGEDGRAAAAADRL